MTEKNTSMNAAVILEKLPLVMAAVSSTLYVLGFIVVTSYLAGIGIYDQPLISTKYILAGALVTVVSIAYYFFVWRRVVERVRIGVRWPTQPSALLRVFLDTYYVVEHAFGCCFVAVMLLTLMGHSEYIGVQVLVMIAFGIDFLLIYTNSYAHYRRLSFALTFVLNFLAIGICWVFGYSHQPLLSLIVIFLSLTLVGSMVLASENWKSGGDRPYGIFYIALYVLIGVIGFGATVYEFINPKYGGSAPTLVTVQLSSSVDDSIRNQLKANEKNVYLLLETDSRSTFKIGVTGTATSILQLDRKDVQAITYHSASTPGKTAAADDGKAAIGGFEELIKLFTSKPSAPTGTVGAVK
jgi:hypothetical protein